jgi:hypothetical protein
VDLPTPPAALAALANFVRSRLADLHVPATARQVALVIVGAAAPFAPNSYARTRLLRQMHAAGLLSATETDSAERLLRVSD